MRRIHLYKDFWNPRIGEDYLKYRHEKGNKHNKLLKGVYLNDEMKTKIVGHIPFQQFLNLSQPKPRCMVTGMQTNRGTGFGLKIPVKYTLYVHEMSLQEKIKKQMDNMNNIKKKHLK